MHKSNLLFSLCVLPVFLTLATTIEKVTLCSVLRKYRVDLLRHDKYLYMTLPLFILLPLRIFCPCSVSSVVKYIPEEILSLINSTVNPRTTIPCNFIRVPSERCYQMNYYQLNNKNQTSRIETLSKQLLLK